AMRADFKYSAATPDCKPSSRKPGLPRRSRPPLLDRPGCLSVGPVMPDGHPRAYGFLPHHLRRGPADDNLELAHLRENTQQPSELDREVATMNYVLQVVRGRSATTNLRLGDGVTSLGRHDDCIIRIKSSQVSRRHCELLEVDGRLTVRDLGSSNG